MVTDVNVDGFALLKGDMIYAQGEMGMNTHLKGVTVGQIRGQVDAKGLNSA